MPAPPLIVLVHGILTGAGDIDGSIGRLGSLFTGAGFSVAPPYHYGCQGLIDVRGSRDEVAHGLLSMLRTAAQWHDGEIIPVGHSRGCLAICDAADRQDPKARLFKRAVYISPALDRKRKRPDSLDSIDVCHTRNDDTVWWARLLALHPFGDMGRAGYAGKDVRVSNLDATAAVDGHSGWWEPKGLEWLRQNLIPRLYDRTGFTPRPIGIFPL